MKVTKCQKAVPHYTAVHMEDEVREGAPSTPENLVPPIKAASSKKVVILLWAKLPPTSRVLFRQLRPGPRQLSCEETQCHTQSMAHGGAEGRQLCPWECAKVPRPLCYVGLFSFRNFP